MKCNTRAGELAEGTALNQGDPVVIAAPAANLAGGARTCPLPLLRVTRYQSFGRDYQAAVPGSDLPPWQKPGGNIMNRLITIARHSAICHPRAKKTLTGILWVFLVIAYIVLYEGSGVIAAQITDTRFGRFVVSMGLWLIGGAVLGGVDALIEWLGGTPPNDEHDNPHQAA